MKVGCSGIALWHYKRDYILQNRPVTETMLLTAATLYFMYICVYILTHAARGIQVYILKVSCSGIALWHIMTHRGTCVLHIKDDRVLQCVQVCVAVCCSVLQRVAACCRVLQCVAVCCRVLPCVEVRCSALQCAVLSCSVMLCIAVCCRILVP